MKLPTVKSHFWRWFVRHAGDYSRLHTRRKKEMDYLFNELNMHLRAYCKHLGAAVWTDGENGRATLVITAHGNWRYFNKVERLVAAAPAIEHWHIRALHPPMEPGALLDVFFPDVCIDPHRLWFEVLDDEGPGGYKDIIVYSHLYPIHGDRRFEGAVNLVVGDILGERLLALHIRSILVANLSRATCMENLLRLEELPSLIDTNPSGEFEVNAAGGLQLRRRP